MHVTDAAGTPSNWDLYLKAVVDIRFGDRTVRVEPRPSGTAEGLFPEAAGGATVHVITAWNARGRIASAQDNARAQGLLLDEIRRRRLTWWPADGRDACSPHHEKSVAVVGLSDTVARELGNRFGQDAIFAWTPDAWRVLACNSDAGAVSGWAVILENGRTSSSHPTDEAGGDHSDRPLARRRRLRRIIAETFSLDGVIPLCDPNKVRIKSFEDRTTGDYERVLSCPVGAPVAAHRPQY